MTGGDMTEGVYPFKVGSFECAVVSDGTTILMPEAAKILFANAPEAELVTALQAHGIVGYDIPYRMNCLYIRTDSHQVLVDTGLGGGVHPALGQLLANLNAIGVTPEQIDTLIVTHGHGDHIGGLTDASGKLIFPNARYFMRQPEWEFWTAEDSLAKMDDFGREFANKNLPPLTSKINLITGEDEIVPGIRAIFADGHTPAHMALSIMSQGEELLFLVDTVLDSIQIEHPDWLAAMDALPDAVVSTRHKLFERAAASNALTLFYHFPFPGLGKIVRADAGYGWQTI
jgi:glyoxylase-like metal-dependent hydrolase (beta-lactamase superfamily II)